MAEGGVKPLDAHPAQSARVLVQGEHQVAQTVIENAVGGIGGLEQAEAKAATTQLRLLRKYGKGGFRELADGRRRYYGVLKPARNVGATAGSRLVREWNPATDKMRTWFETVDHAGNVRQVRPETGGAKVHYQFDVSGKYTGKW